MRKFYSLITLIIALVCCSGIAKADDFNIGYSYGNATGATPLVRTNVSENSAAVYILQNMRRLSRETFLRASHSTLISAPDFRQ